MAVLLSTFETVIYAYLSHNKRSLFIKICVHLYKTMSITSFLLVHSGQAHPKVMIYIYIIHKVDGFIL